MEIKKLLLWNKSIGSWFSTLPLKCYLVFFGPYRIFLTFALLQNWHSISKGFEFLFKFLKPLELYGPRFFPIWRNSYEERLLYPSPIINCWLSKTTEIPLDVKNITRNFSLKFYNIPFSTRRNNLPIRGHSTNARLITRIPDVLGIQIGDERAPYIVAPACANQHAKRQRPCSREQVIITYLESPLAV